MTSPGRTAPRRGPGIDLVPALRSLRELGRFDEAAALVHETDPATMSPQLHAAAGSALTAVSEYDAAGVHLLLAAVDPAQAPAALGLLAELAWIRHDRARGRAFALEGLAIDPSDAGCRVQLHRNETGPGHGRPGARGRLAHAAAYPDPQGNAGARYQIGVLPPLLRSGTGPAGWHDVHVHQVFDDRRLAEVNAADALVIGGGGLFAPDTAPNGNSGWQWNVRDEVLRRIEVPVVAFAIGSDLLESPHPAGERFAHSLRVLAERAAFVGLRNQGSVRLIRELLPPELAGRVHWQPCPTTFAALLDVTPPIPRDQAVLPGSEPTPAAAPQNPRDQAIVPGPVRTPPVPRRGGPDTVIDLREGNGSAGADVEPGAVLLNCAYDRVGRRFGDTYREFLTQLHEWVISTRELAPVQYVAHRPDDEKLVTDLRREYGITLPVIPLHDRAPAAIARTYRDARLVVAMRGYATSIPFGLGTPIISLLSHPGPGYFLDDIGRPEWGVPVEDPRLGGRLRDLTAHLLDTHADVVAEIALIQHRLHAVTRQNVASLPVVLHPVVQ